MFPLRLLLAEIGHRKLNFVLSVAAVVAAVALVVAAPVLVDAYQRETREQVNQWQAKVEESEGLVLAMQRELKEADARTQQELAALQDETRKTMLGMGFNLQIVPAGTDLGGLVESSVASRTMPEEYVARLAKDPRLTLVTHLVATLQGKIDWEGRKVLVVGYLPETPQAHLAQKKPMGHQVKRGEVFLGSELAKGKKVGDTIAVAGRQLKVARVLESEGSVEDITLAMHLSDAQAALNQPGQINQILAIDCQCPGSDMAMIRRQVATALPNTEVTERRSIRLARAEQRAAVEANRKTILAQMQKNLDQQEQLYADRKEMLASVEDRRAKVQQLVETLADVVTPLVVLASAVWVGLLALANVRQRRTEIGLLRALGKGSGLIASLLLSKAVLVGLLGAAIGVLVALGVAGWMERQFLGVSNASSPRWDIVLAALLGAPLVSALASYLPTLTAIVQDPAKVLRES
jgi:ABC-type lipoprotein release transport system permease subunit